MIRLSHVLSKIITESDFWATGGLIILKNHVHCLVNLNMKHDHSMMDVIPCSSQSGFRHLPTRGLWKTSPCQNNKYTLAHFHIQLLFEANLHKVKRTDNIYRMFQDSVYINCLQYQFYSDNILKFTVKSLDSLILFLCEHIQWLSLFAFSWQFWVCSIDSKKLVFATILHDCSYHVKSLYQVSKMRLPKVHYP